MSSDTSSTFISTLKRGLISSAIERPYSSFRRYVEARVYPADWGQGAMYFEGVGHE